MEKIKTLTVGTDTYQLCDPEAARVDDMAVGDTVWSSRKLVECLCPVFETTDSAAVCKPVEGSILAVTGQIAFSQTGSGTASPENIRPILASDTLVLTHSNQQTSQQYMAVGDRQICSGSYDWQTGVLVLDRLLVTFAGAEKLTSHANEVGYTISPTAKDNINAVQCTCSHYPGIDRWTGYRNAATPGFRGVSTNGGIIRFIDNVSFPGGDAVGMAAYFRQQYEAGTPVQLAYQLAEPIRLQLEPAKINALSGSNTLQCNLGLVTVSGRSDLCELLKAHGIQ